MSPATKLALACATIGAASGCGGAPVAPIVCATPGAIEVALESGPLLNPDADGRALPTEVRLYRMRDASVFETVAFDTVWQSDTDALGDAMLGMDVVTLYPGESATGNVVPGEDAHAIVAMAIVRQPAGRTWRTVVDVTDLPCGSSAHVRLRVDEYRIERASALTGGQ